MLNDIFYVKGSTFGNTYDINVPGKTWEWVEVHIYLLFAYDPYIYEYDALDTLYITELF